MVNKLTVKAEKKRSMLSFDADMNVLNVSELKKCCLLLLFRVQALLILTRFSISNTAGGQ